ncbi:unnamed protein product [Prorocentrum cordatum]|uniref:Protein-serine/threonine phosphatase n=1 Tax=Prorocentrum cordatum TaxID=2364126 RepID=A0ABN9SEL6_9DINO|nr:unnamed protein product [Polarella glacialis]
MSRKSQSAVVLAPALWPAGDILGHIALGSQVGFVIHWVVFVHSPSGGLSETAMDELRRLFPYLASGSSEPQQRLGLGRLLAESAQSAAAGGSERLAQEGCHTASPGEKCYDAVLRAMTVGIAKNSSDYPGLTPRSSFAEFQVLLHSTKDADCPLPCEAQGPPMANCLCLFDVDRTLTAKQNSEHCHRNGTYLVPGVADTAYHGGGLVLSELAQNVRRSFCGSCLRGVLSNGDVGGPHSAMRHVVSAVLGGPEWTLTNKWEHYVDGRRSTLMVGIPNAEKARVAADVVSWSEVEIEKTRVYFFDDSAENVRQFKGTGMNAQQISCTSRDKGAHLGVCGGRTDELSEDGGVLTCEDKGSPVDVVDEEDEAGDDYFLAT